MTRSVPEEIAEGLAAYELAHEKIRDRVEANRRRYRGRKYEDCPPLLREQLTFAVRRSEVVEEQKRLRERYGLCPHRWAYAVVWFKRRAADVKQRRGVRMQAERS